MVEHFLEALDKRNRKILAILLVVLAPASLLLKCIPSEVEGFPLVKTQAGWPTLKDRIQDVTLDIKDIEKARVLIKKNACEATKKENCTPVSYQAMSRDLGSAIGILAWAKIEGIQDCQKLYGKSQKECADYFEDLHSAIHIVEDLNKTIKRKDNADQSITSEDIKKTIETDNANKTVTSEENEIILKYLGKLTEHQESLKKVLKCLEDDSEKDKTRCESLRPPRY